MVLISESKWFPFDCIVVTSPDAASAESAKAPLRRILDHRLQRDYPGQSIRVISTYDSYGARCGSGGGTLAALEFAEPGESVLVLHAGGESSRCPTQMILGKAWTRLPSHQYSNPTIWLIDQIQKLFQNARFPRGTVVVAATDTLLTFFDHNAPCCDSNVNLSFDWNSEQEKSALVIGIAVPAVVETATNHGVYVLSKDVAGSRGLTVTDPLEVWQKPSVQQLTTTQVPAAASFQCRAGRHVAWIDTGVIVFLPKAVAVLEELSHGILAMCTRKGIMAAYEKQGDTTMSIEAFAKANARNVDLYTEIMHNLTWPSRMSSNEEESSSTLRKCLAKVALKIMVVPQGQFLHLGTTEELANFVTSGAYSSCTESTESTIGSMSSQILLQPRHQCWMEALPLDHNVALCSLFPSNALIGRNSVVEYCDFDGYNSLVIGSNCMVSGWRNATRHTAPFQIPDNVSVQMLALRQAHGARAEFVYMVLGTCDKVKVERSSATIFGLSVSDFLERTGMTCADLGWTDSLGIKDHTFWNATLHVRVHENVSFASMYSWLNTLFRGESVVNDPSFQTWLLCPRVSLRALHDLADPVLEWNFRQEQESRVRRLMGANVVAYLQQILRGRHNDTPCDLQWIVELPDVTEATGLVIQILTVLEDLALEELAKNNFDISGRAFMIASALLDDFAEKLDGRIEDPDRSGEKIASFCSALILQIRSLSLQPSPAHVASGHLAKIIDHRRSHLTTTSIDNPRVFSEVMERLSFCMNELSIGWGYRQFLEYSGEGSFIVRKETPITDKWVESSSPARVDLAGGWTDTPPICYEFGGAVTGMAILVDSQKPLSCRCRLVSGRTGILLRSENRRGEDQALVSAVEVDIHDLRGLVDFREPLSDCALLKAALICLCMVSEDELLSNVSLQSKINAFCSSGGAEVRLEIVSASSLPQGSGMGTSSILAATVLACISKCVGIGELDEDFLLHAVLMLEQLLTSGGGWQDQAHGIIPGVKMVSSAPSQLPIALTVDRIPLSESLKKELERRMILVFTGKTRLAKNILQDVLRRWSRRTNEVVSTVSRNVDLAGDCRAALLAEDVNRIGEILLEYSAIKVRGMAGEDSGALPHSCNIFIKSLLETKMINGASLCGAGGGGFMVLLLSNDHTKERVADFLETHLVHVHPHLSGFTLHSCQVCEEGLTTVVLDEGLQLHISKVMVAFREQPTSRDDIVYCDYPK